MLGKKRGNLGEHRKKQRRKPVENKGFGRAKTAGGVHLAVCLYTGGCPRRLSLHGGAWPPFVFTQGGEKETNRLTSADQKSATYQRKRIPAAKVPIKQDSERKAFQALGIVHQVIGYHHATKTA